LYIPVNGAIPDAMLREPEPAPRAPVTHIVRRGETLSGIARRYGVAQASVRAANKLPSNGAIRAGQKLTIPGSATNPAGTTASSAPRVHVVRAGETVGEIAQRYSVP